MRIDGKVVAAEIIQNLESQVSELKKKNITPKIAIVTLGSGAAWQTYVNQKIKLAKNLGIDAELINLSDPTEATLLETLNRLNADNSVHGVIIQRPFPANIHNDVMINAVAAEKDIDGFRADSPYEVPAWLVVWHIIQFVHKETSPQTDLFDWLKLRKIVIIGKGATAGKPTADSLKRFGLNPIVIDSSTKNVSSILKSADIIVGAVGKKVIQPENLKKGVVLIGIGLHRGEDGKLHGDYDDEEIDQIASFYTPSPGGVGPINLAYLFQNLIKASENSSL
jgi:methylenetetrahydrofolate dehydrogenase (NADP+) / methenyltetrahydrofolate cyclohydrolase